MIVCCLARLNDTSYNLPEESLKLLRKTHCPRAPRGKVQTADLNSNEQTPRREGRQNPRGLLPVVLPPLAAQTVVHPSLAAPNIVRPPSRFVVLIQARSFDFNQLVFGFLWFLLSSAYGNIQKRPSYFYFGEKGPECSNLTSPFFGFPNSRVFSPP